MDLLCDHLIGLVEILRINERSSVVGISYFPPKVWLTSFISFSKTLKRYQAGMC